MRKAEAVLACRGPGVTGPADSQPAAGQSQAAETWAKVRGRYGQGLTSLAAPGQASPCSQVWLEMCGRSSATCNLNPAK